MLALSHQLDRSPIFVPEVDYEALCLLADEARSPGATLLREELERVTVVKKDAGPRAFARLNSRVDFTDLGSGRTRTVTLVDPSLADMDANRLSVLAPAGAALLGFRPGDRFRWSFQGRLRSLAVIRVAAR